MYEGGLQYSFDHMKRCLTIERFGGVCLFNLCASGETLLFSKLPEIVEMLLGLGHWVSIVTNLTIEKTLNKILQLPKELLQYTFFKCSFHYLELKRLNLLDIFFYNVELLKQKGIAFTVELTVNDETIPFIDEIKTVSMQRLGALPHVIESRNEGEEHLYRLTKLPVDEHQKIWGSFESPLFNYQQKNWDKQITNFCYAGDWRISLEINDGSVHQCDCIFVDTRLQNIFEIDGGGGGIPSPQSAEIVLCDTAMPRITSRVLSTPSWNIPEYKFAAIGANCPLKHCFPAYYQSCLVNCFGEWK
jgi:hypothetical protein